MLKICLIIPLLTQCLNDLNKDYQLSNSVPVEDGWFITEKSLIIEIKLVSKEKTLQNEI